MSGLANHLPALLLAVACASGSAQEWAGAQELGGLALQVDGAESLPGVATNVAASFFAAYPRICALLGVEGSGMVRRLEIHFATNLPPRVPAATSGARMRVSVEHARAHPEDLRGLLVHEWTHTVQAYPRPEPGWVTEGIADAVRLLLSEPEDPWRRRIEQAPRAATDYRHGYGEAARFLLWIRAQERPDLLIQLNDAMRKSVCDEAWWSRVTGAAPEDWWARYLASGGGSDRR